MNKEEFIKAFGPRLYKEKLASAREWKNEHPQIVIETSHQSNRKGGIYYERHLRYQHSGLQGKRNTIRARHARRWSKYKKMVAPGSQIHHEWIPKTAKYRGVALVETGAHRYGIVDVIQILKGEITLLTEEKNRM